MKSTITSKGQITIPVKIRRKPNLKPGQVLEFDEKGPYLKATKVFDSRGLYLIGYSFMPAQQFHIEKARTNHGEEGWFSVDGYRRCLFEFLPYGPLLLRRFPRP
jgi:AbrB family looped-hinge helix DNA binding protein